MRIYKLFVLSMLLGVFACGIAGAEVWDLAVDWSDATNPNGVWSYNTDIDLPMTDHQDDYGLFDGDPPQPAWAFFPVSVPGLHLPSFFKSVSENSGGAGDIPLDRVFVHGNDIWNSPDPHKNSTANITWTNPSAVDIQISGGVWLVSPDLGRNMAWRILINGALVTSGTILYTDAHDSSSPMDFSLGSGGASALLQSVALGDELRLEVLRTTDVATFVGIDFSIEALTSISVPDGNLSSAVLILEPNHPNPFNPKTDLAFNLSADAHVRLSIFDLQGRRVRTVLDGPLPAGRHEREWDGRDSPRGHSSPPSTSSALVSASAGLHGHEQGDCVFVEVEILGGVTVPVHFGVRHMRHCDIGTLALAAARRFTPSRANLLALTMNLILESAHGL